MAKIIQMKERPRRASEEEGGSKGDIVVVLREPTFPPFIDPGTRVAVRIPFELPNGQRVHLVELHDSGFSNGALVRV